MSDILSRAKKQLETTKARLLESQMQQQEILKIREELQKEYNQKFEEVQKKLLVASREVMLLSQAAVTLENVINPEVEPTSVEPTSVDSDDPADVVWTDQDEVLEEKVDQSPTRKLRIGKNNVKKEEA